MKSLTLAAGPRRPHAHPVESDAARRERLRLEDEHRQQQLYGEHLDDVHVLRRRGFTVTAKVAGTYLLDSVIVDGATLKAKADRERRLMGTPELRQPTETANGLKVGQVVKIGHAPKAAAPVNRPAPIARETAIAVNPTARSVNRAAPPRAPRKLSGAALTARQAAAEHSTDLGVRPRVLWLDLDLLQVDRRYQREIGQAGVTHVNRIAREFNWNRFQPIVVSEGTDGRYAVIDGQHRFEAAKKHPLIRELPCYIIDAPDLAAQAAIFVSVNSRRLALTGLQKFWADVAADNAEALAVRKICEEAGVTILRSTPSSDIPPGSVYCALSLQRLVRRLGRSRVETAVKLVAETHGEEPNAFRAPTLAALAIIAGDPVFSVGRTRSALQALDLGRIYEDARLDRITAGGTLETATERVLRQKFGTAEGA